MEPKELARRALPWYLTAKFKNALLALPDNIDVKRNVETYVKVDLSVNAVAGIFVPGASRFLMVPHVEYSSEVDKNEKKIRIHVKDGFVSGFLPDGKYVKLLAGTITKGDPIELNFEKDYTDFAVDTVVRNFLRINAGTIFGGRVEAYAKSRGVFFKGLGNYVLSDILLREGSVYTTVKLPTKLYHVQYKDESFIAPGVVAAVLHLIGIGKFDPLADHPDAKQALADFIKKVDDVGSKLAGVSGSILQATSKTRFTYIIGEVSGPERVMKSIKEREWLTGFTPYRGVRANIYLSPPNRVTLTLSVLPFVAPATTVLNYSPFNMAPLAALMDQSAKQLREALDKAETQLNKRRLSAGFYDADYEVLADAKVTFEDVKRVLRDGYPRLENLEKVLEKLERLGYIGDIVSHAYGKETKIDRILIKELRELARTESKAEKKEKEESEEESVLL